MFVKELLDAHQEFVSGAIDFNTYKSKIEAVMDRVSQQSDEEKAKAFDAIFESVRGSMTDQDEPYDGDPNAMWYDSDSIHYVWENTNQAIFGEDFFDFHNRAYTSG